MSMEGTIYKGMRIDGDAQVLVMTDKTMQPLPVRLDVIEHSPDGFEWGYAGSGPAQLAMALCIDALGGNEPGAHAGIISRARTVYHRFMVEHLSQLPGPRVHNDEWSFTGNQVRQWIEVIEQRLIDAIEKRGS